MSVTFSWTPVRPDQIIETWPNILYAGPGPLEIEGVGQINVVVPSTPGPGLATGGPFVYIEVSPSNGGFFSSAVALWTK